MRAALLLLLLPALFGCAGAGFYAAAEAGFYASAVTGRDCSIVRLDRGQTYCAPRDPTPPPQPFCTRTLGVANCWADPALLPPDQHELGDTPPPTEDQIRYRTARWPKSLFF